MYSSLHVHQRGLCQTFQRAAAEHTQGSSTWYSFATGEAVGFRQGGEVSTIPVAKKARMTRKNGSTFFIQTVAHDKWAEVKPIDVE